MSAETVPARVTRGGGPPPGDFFGPVMRGEQTAKASRMRTVLNSRALRTHFGTAAGVVILAVLLWRTGTGVFLDGLRGIMTNP